MAEAEDVIVDVAWRATSYAQTLWRRHHPKRCGPATVRLADVAPRIDLLIRTVFGTGYPIAIARAAAPVTLLSRLIRRADRPRSTDAVPGTDGSMLWLPQDSGIVDPVQGLERLRLLALVQAMRAERGSSSLLARLLTPLARDIYLLLEAQSADEALVRRLPGLVGPLNALRRAALNARPDLASFAGIRHRLECRVRGILSRPLERGSSRMTLPHESLALASQWADALALGLDSATAGTQPLFRDFWTGHLTPPRAHASTVRSGDDEGPEDSARSTIRSARLRRRPDLRTAPEDEDDSRPGAWMVQASQPHEVAEDPFGMQRPTDRDEDGAADDYAESLAELAQARLVWTPTQAKEVLLSDDLPPGGTRAVGRGSPEGSGLEYPEWDYRIAAYRTPGATVRARLASPGDRDWVEATLTLHRPMLDTVRRRFEVLRARRAVRRKQTEGDDFDLDAWVEARADFRAGLPMSAALYQSRPRKERDLAILLLVDVSGSTDGWIAAHRRVIDVEREALLVVCIALAGLGAPYAIQAFSGHGPRSVCVDDVKRFDEPYGDDVALRIAGLEPDRFTRVGTAVRHASAGLMRQGAAHRLLLLLSDGKPNDVDLYEGRYGVEDTRQAINEAKLQGISPFCLTVDRGGGGYLPTLFGAQHYALLSRPESLPAVLLDWMRRLLIA